MDAMVRNHLRRIVGHVMAHDNRRKSPVKIRSRGHLVDKWLKTGTLKRSASVTEIRTTDSAALEISVDQQDDNHEVQRPTDWPVEYHKKPSTRPALAPGFTLNDRPPRLHWALWSPRNSPHYKRLMRRLSILPGYDPSSEIDPKSHTKGARTCLLIRQLLIRNI
ncbi:hypothetical protein AVEN_66040-1 [Araneus ventricosus]|uniref:Uncharacterized protein n=1 Tax=Araneus ventricosus TaxID=182803 RepID=A0A4Y2JZX2_ARAVE|nr:hypothetical protein AVEN_66040-1 [Araneus ventricosus]